ncbi:MAG: hypothetical protein Q7V63_08050 [Gammaproteobacteria bacterium]|nr:hypothetical protein [Gammaproteobacteria bacterium]
MIIKKMLIASCLLLALPSFAATLPLSNATDYCSQLSGSWEGTYKDPTGLFVNQAFPLRLALQASNGNFYGYTMKSSDNNGAKFGAQPWLIFGTCSNNMITRLYVINPNNTPACGDPAEKMSPLIESKILFLYIPWENAMTGTTFHGSLHKNSTTFEVNQGLIDAARQLSKTQITTCH